MAVSDLLLNILTRSDKRGLRETADEFDKLGRKADDAGGKLGGVAKESGHVDDQLEKTKAKLRELSEEFDKTGKKELLPQLRRERGYLTSLAKIKKDLDDAGDEGGKGFVASLSSAVDGGLQSVGKLVASHPYIAAGVAAGITLGLPLIGAALTAAVGGGVIAGGILLAAKDPRVGHAWSALGESAMDKLSRSADVFVVPLVHGAEVFGHTLDRIMPSIEADFNRLAPVADKLFAGAAGAVENLMPGIDALSRAAGPILTDLANELPRLTASLSQMFTDIAAGGPGAAAALRDFLTVTEMTIVNIGALIGALEKYYVVDRAFKSILAATLTNNQPAWDNAVMSVAELKYGTEAVTPVADKAVDAYKRFAAAVGVTGQGAQLTAEQLKTLSGQIDATVLTTDTLAGKMTDRLMGTMLGMSHANLGVAESLNSLKDTLGTTGLAIDRHTGQVSMSSKAGLALRESVLGGVEANLRMYDAQIASGVGADVATAKYEANTKALHDQLIAAHFTEAQVSDLIGEYGKVPGKVSTAIATQGLTEAINNLNTLLRQLLGLPTYKKITIDQVTVSRRIDAGNPVGGGVRIQRWGGIWQHAAVGTLRDAQVYSSVSSGARYAFAEPETGGEAFIPKFGDRGRSMGILSQAASWYGATVVPGGGGSSGASGGSVGRGGGGTVTEWHTAAPGDQVAEVLLSLLRPTVRGRYGGDVSVAMGGAN